MENYQEKKMKHTKRSMRKAVSRILAGMTVCMVTAVSLGCGSLWENKGKNSAYAYQLSDSTEDLTGQYRKGKHVENVPVTDTFRQGYGDFSLRLLKESRKEAGENPMVSPLSVMMALEMTRSGARGETEGQMAETLYGEALPEEISRELVSYLQGLPSQEKARFHFANSIWFQKNDSGFQVDEDFLKNSAENYGAYIYAAPFDESTLKDINGWVEQETEGMIPDILEKAPEGAIMYLINAMAFDGQWKETYTSNQVSNSEFYPEEGDPQNVKMMYSTEEYLIGDESAKGFLKPYEEGYAFAALLPEEGIDIDTYLEGLTGEHFINMIDQPQEISLMAGIPKFSAETGLTLNQVLEDLGMGLAFDPEQADFSGMGLLEDGNIYIGQVIHSTFIQVDEQGTKAGAATVVEMEAGGAGPSEEVLLNRPFLYAIIDTETNLPIFLGIMESSDGNEMKMK